MLLFFFILAFISNLICSVTNKRLAFVKWLTLIMIWIIMLGNTYVADYNNYLYYYYNYRTAAYQTPDYLFKLFVVLGRLIGIKYAVFRGFLNAIFLMILDYCVKKFSQKNEHYFYLFYSIFVLFMDAIQLRFFYASTLVLLSVLLFQKKDKLFKYFGFILLCLACSLHGGVILFLFSWVLSIYINIQKKYYNYILFLIIAILVIFVRTGTLSKIVTILPFTHRVSKYLTSCARYGFLAMWILHFITYFCIRYLYSNTKLDKLGNKIYELIKIGFLFFPLYMANVNFYRHIRLLTIFLIIVGARQFGKNNSTLSEIIIIKGRIIYNVLLLNLTFVWLIYEVIFDKMISNILFPIFLLPYS